jgi:hypothetical protein
MGTLLFGRCKTHLGCGLRDGCRCEFVIVKKVGGQNFGGAALIFRASI